MVIFLKSIANDIMIMNKIYHKIVMCYIPENWVVWDVFFLKRMKYATDLQYFSKT